MAKEKIMGTTQITDMNAFASTVKQMLEQTHPSADVEIQEVSKNNNLMLTGITIHEAGSNIAPNIYLEDFFEAYRNGKPLDEVCHAIEEIHKKATPDSNFDVDVITDFSAVKGNICYKLVNAEKNASRLKNMPHRLWHDLSIVYYVSVSVKSATDIASITVNNSMMGLWGGVDEDTLYRYAHINTPKLFKAEIMPMMEMMKSLLFGMAGSEMEMPAGDLKGMPPLYVATNDRRINGASVLLYDGVLEKFAQQIGGDFYILPSSIHETLFLPAMPDADDGDDMAELVREVNAGGEVAPEDILSDNAYFYDSKDNSLRLIK